MEKSVYHVRPCSYDLASFETVVKTYTTTKGWGVPAPAGQTTTSQLCTLRCSTIVGRQFACQKNSCTLIEKRYVISSPKTWVKKNLRSLRAACVNSGAKSRPCGLMRRPSRSASPRPSIFDHNTSMLALHCSDDSRYP